MKNFLIILLSVCCGVLLCVLYVNRKEIEAVKFQSDYLEIGLKRTMELKERTLIHKVRLSKSADCLEGNSSSQSTRTEKYYIPPEGSFSYVEKEGGEYKLEVKDYGFTFKLYFGVGANIEGEITPLMAARLFYYGRWGVGCGYSLNDGAAVLFERRTDDFLPFDNTILFLGAGKNTAVFGAAVFL